MAAAVLKEVFAAADFTEARFAMEVAGRPLAVVAADTARTEFARLRAAMLARKMFNPFERVPALHMISEEYLLPG